MQRVPNQSPCEFGGQTLFSGYCFAILEASGAFCASTYFQCPLGFKITLSPFAVVTSIFSPISAAKLMLVPRKKWS